MSKLEQLNILKSQVSACKKCPLLVEHRSQIVFGEGNPDSELVLLGEAPGQSEDETGRPFAGRAGELLDSILQNVGINREDIYILNILKCRPPKNRTPKPDEAANCRPFLNQQLAIIKPKYIVCMGGSATKHFLDVEAGITSLRGSWREHEGFQVYCTFHPSYALRCGELIKTQIQEDFQRVLEEIKNNR